MKPVRFSDHVRLEIVRRDIPFEIVERVLNNPEQSVSEHGGLVAQQSRIELEGKQYLVRVIVAERPDATVVVTAYRTSRINRYWRSR